MKVRAIRDGYYGDMMRYAEKPAKEASVFTLVPFTIIDPITKKQRTVTAEEQFSHEWMERLDGPAPARKRTMPGDIVPPPPPPSMPDAPPTPLERTELPAAPEPEVRATGNQDVI